MQDNDSPNCELSDDLELIRTAARHAGDIAMTYFRKNPEVWMKQGESPVSEADFAVNTFLKNTLMKARPDYGWLSEESADTSPRKDRTFVIDPIDGTRAFLKGNDVWCVSVAIVESGRTLTGVLACPAREEIYSALLQGGAACNGNRISVRHNQGALKIAGPNDMIRTLARHVKSEFRVADYIPSLAYRLAMVANGELDASFVKANAHDWDVAAADLILSEAGGSLLDQNGHPPYYAGQITSLGPLAAGSGELVGLMSGLLIEDRR